MPDNYELINNTYYETQLYFDSNKCVKTFSAGMDFLAHTFIIPCSDFETFTIHFAGRDELNYHRLNFKEMRSGYGVDRQNINFRGQSIVTFSFFGFRYRNFNCRLLLLGDMKKYI